MSNAAPLPRARASRPLGRHRTASRRIRRGDPRPLVVGQVGERLFAEHLDAARHDPDRGLVVGFAPRRRPRASSPPSARPGSRGRRAVRPSRSCSAPPPEVELDAELTLGRERCGSTPRTPRRTPRCPCLSYPMSRGPAGPVQRVTIDEAEGAARQKVRIRSLPPGRPRARRSRPKATSGAIGSVVAAGMTPSNRCRMNAVNGQEEEQKGVDSRPVRRAKMTTSLAWDRHHASQIDRCGIRAAQR